MELRDIDQMSYEEISNITNLSLNTIRVNLSRARKRVRDEFLKINSDGKDRGKTIAAALF
jgi:RNA polymerase sigma-70 factor (ECF subfamily)